MFIDIKIDRKTCKRTCPNCGEEGKLEWVAGKTNDSEQEYICRGCRINVRLIGMTSEDQDILAEEAFD